MVTSRMVRLLFVCALVASFELCALGYTGCWKQSSYRSGLVARICKIAGLRRLTHIQGEAPRYLVFPYLQADSMPLNTFARYFSVEVLSLPNSKLKALSVGVFEPLTKLRVIDLAHSLLTTLPDGIFAKNGRLEKVILDDSRLTTLPVGIFAKNSALQFVSLRKTFIGELPSQLFANNPTLKEVDLTDTNVQLDRVLCALFEVRKVIGNEVNTENIRNLPVEPHCGNSEKLCHRSPGFPDKLHCKCPAGQRYNGTHCGPPCLNGTVAGTCTCNADQVMSSDGRSCVPNKCTQNCNSEGQACWLTKDEPGYVCDCIQPGHLRASGGSETCTNVVEHCSRTGVHNFFNRATSSCSCRPGYVYPRGSSGYTCRAGVDGIAGDYSCMDHFNPVYLFLPASPKPSGKISVGLTRSIDEAVQQCVEKGGDIPHLMEEGSCQPTFEGALIPQKYINNGYYHRDSEILSQIRQGEPKFVLCQRPVHRCSLFGTLAVPKKINFNATFDLATAESKCNELGFTLPDRTAPGARACVTDFQTRMKELFRMRLQPMIWWQGDSGGYRHLVCHIPKSGGPLSPPESIYNSE